MVVDKDRLAGALARAIQENNRFLDIRSARFIVDSALKSVSTETKTLEVNVYEDIRCIRGHEFDEVILKRFNPDCLTHMQWLWAAKAAVRSSDGHVVIRF
jgi:hypothetical protein